MSALQPRAALPAALRSRLWRATEQAAQPARSSGHATLDAVLPGGGWPLGAVSEILHPGPGHGELSLCLPALAALAREGRAIGCVAAPARPYAPGLVQAGLPLSQLVCVEAPDTGLALWSAEQLLRAEVGGLLLWADRVEAAALRRLQLAAEEASSLVFLLREGQAHREASTAALRLWLERRAEGLQLQVLKCRGAVPRGGLRLSA
ncbi:MAG TPA: translesion DNA synthesis-associated protein ImuA [Nevskiaceae bacterium]|nr:translesion DNA synthesis-associated protein ImuA [Nevskiaceae bacterium]